VSQDGGHRSIAGTRRSWGPGWIWAVPIAAIAVAGWLSIRALSRGGEEVTVVFDNAYGLKQGGTPVMLRGVKVGDVAAVSLGRGLQDARVKLRLDSDVDRYLTSGTRFWLVGAKFDLADPSSLKGLLAGPQVAMSPGPGKPTRLFQGLDQPPAMPLPANGAAFVLTADQLGGLRAGSPVFCGQDAAGKVTAVRLLGPHAFEVDVFVNAPFDRLVGAHTRFWNSGAFQVSATSSGVKAQLLSPTALISGALSFDTPPDAAAGPAAPAGARFALFDDEGAAKNAAIGPQVAYAIRFQGPVGGLAAGAPVMMDGFRIGRVTSVRLGYDAAAGRLITPVGIALEPALLHIEHAGAAASTDWRPAVDAMLRRLIARGLRARLAQDPPIVGAHRVELVFAPGSGVAALVARDGVETIPATTSGDFAAIAGHADQVLVKLDKVPFARIGENLRQATGRIRALVSSPKLADSLNNLDRSLAEVDLAIHEAGPQVGPLVAKMRGAADEADRAAAAARRIVAGDPASQDSDLPSALHELTDAARSIRVLADYLERHPEALIEGKAKQKSPR